MKFCLKPILPAVCEKNVSASFIPRSAENHTCQRNPKLVSERNHYCVMSWFKSQLISFYQAKNSLKLVFIQNCTCTWQPCSLSKYTCRIGGLTHYDQKAVHRSIFVTISMTIPKMFDTYSFLTFSSRDESLDSTDECIVFRDESLVKGW